MAGLFYRPKHLLKPTAPPGGSSRFRRRVALLLTICMLLSLFPASVRAAGAYEVKFVNYDLSQLPDSGTYSDVPEGARLYTANELHQEGVEIPSGENCTWYLYYPGGLDVSAYGPYAIADPPKRTGYVFRDWAAQNASGDSVYTVTSDTTFVARYISESQYVLSLYYQFDNEEATVAAETTTIPYGYGDIISVELPQTDSLAGLTPAIPESTELNQWIGNGVFSGTLDDAFLKACLDAGFVAWDAEAGTYQQDEDGNVQIRIPVTYSLTGQVSFTVEYLWQDPENPDKYTVHDSASGSVEGTTRVSLTELGMVKHYEGLTLTAASAEDSSSYNINADGSSVIRLYYDRNLHHIYYRMNGGNVVDPIPLRYEQTIPENIGTVHTRPGYTFESWTWYGENDQLLEQAPSVMPDHDLTMSANWVGTDTTVTLVYWLENANDDGYTVAGQHEITVTSGQTVAYEAPGGVSSTDVSINNYLTPEFMEAAGIQDGEYFTFSDADSSTKWAAGVEGSPKTAAGDGSTVINIGYTRNEYTLVFHLGWEATWSYRVVSGGASSGQTAGDWKSGYSTSFLPWGGSPEMNIGGQTYTITDDENGWYRFSAKYGAYISDKWPIGELISPGGWTGWRPFYGWGAHNLSPYAQTHTATNGVINGIYATMSADLIIDPEKPEIEHHLVAYFDWSTSGNEWRYHYLFEAVSGTGETGSAFAGSEYETYPAVKNIAANGLEAIQGLRFYQFGSAMTVLSLEQIDAQNAPAFANVTYQYGCYSGDDVYFFYTYNDYTVTYHENNANLITGEPAGEQSVGFHYIAGMNLAEELGSFDCDYTPQPPYVSAYGNAYTFDGWYTDADLTFPVDWTTENPVSSVNFFAKWKAPSFTLTLIVPGGTLYEDTLNQFQEKGYDCTVHTDTGENGETRTIYTVSGIPGGTKASEIVSRRNGAQSDYSLAFDYWGYQADGEERRYLFDESQLITADLTLTARWKQEYTGQYTVRYLTTDPQDNGLGTVELDGTVYYRLLDDRKVSGVAVGSSVTVEARAAEGYLSSVGSITKVIQAVSSQDEQICFDFFYTRITADVTYYVHYVRDTGINYGRTQPPPDVVRLSPDKTVTVSAASLNNSTTVSEAAVAIGGYTPRDSWNVSFTLSADDTQNHLYIYYVSNTLEVSFQVIWHFQAADGSYPPEGADARFVMEAQDVLGKALHATELIVDYGQYLEDTQTLDALMQGRVLDEALTQPPLLILTSQPENNVLHIYMKNGSYTLTYFLNGNTVFPASWPDAESFLTPDGTGGSYTQTVTYPTPPSVPATEPQRLAYTFTGWNTEPDGSGTSYTSQTLKDAPWYQPAGLSQDVSLYAQWEEQLTVSFDLRGGQWTDTSGSFHNVGTAETPRWVAYGAAGSSIPRPSDPVRVLDDGTAYSFIGWTDTDPEDWLFVDGENRVDLVGFEAYRFNFGQSLTENIVLYAVWDPDVTVFEIQKTDTGNTPLAGAEFTLERLQATVTGNPQNGYVYQLVTDGNGSYLPDESFPVRSFITGSDGLGAFEGLPAGYYRLTETAAPNGYQGLSQPVILFAPYGGTPELYAPQDDPYVQGTPQGGDLLVTVRNISQYNVTIDAPSTLTLNYTPPDLVWNPETLEYESTGGTTGQWTVSASDGADTAITVSNHSPSTSVTVEVALRYDSGFQALLPLSTLTGPGGFTANDEEDYKALSGTLTQSAVASFELTAAGTLPPDAVLPTQETRAGSVTVRVFGSSG